MPLGLTNDRNPFERLTKIPHDLVENTECTLRNPINSLKMKAPRNVQYDHPHQRRMAPYRPIRRVEQDTVPVHRQVFHRYQPPKAGGIETYQENLEHDTVLVHQRRFPVCLPEVAPVPEARIHSTASNQKDPMSVDSDLNAQATNTSSEEGPSKDGSPGLTHPAAVCVQPAALVRRGETSENGALSLEPSPIPPRRETKLRGVDSTVGRYIYDSDKPLLHPPGGLHPMVGDLFIQKRSNGDMSVWLWNDDRWLSDVGDGHVHPILSDYRLSIRAGSDPTWVTRKTRATYLGKERWRNKSAGSYTVILSYMALN
ncbi:hypothetical protein EDD15DRAFT_2358231 [Pisolithus albus]|nr:hypothetical protein EDD15DRAFT_2358231 [Pisolithus albus]